MATLQHSWAICARPWRPYIVKVLADIQREPLEFQCAPTTTGPVTEHIEKYPSLSFLYFSFRYLCTLMRSPSAFSSPGWKASVLSVFPHKRDAPVPSWSLWPFARLSPVCPSLLCTEEPKTVEHSGCGLTSAKHRWKVKNHISQPSGNMSPKTSHNTINLLYCKGVVPAHIQLGVHQVAWVLFCKASFQLGDSQLI